MYAAGSSEGIFKSKDAGASWFAINNGLFWPYVLILAIDPKNSQILYAGTSNKCVFKSTNGGTSWADYGMHGIYFNHLTIDPIFPDILYAATNGVGIYKTNDGGVHWTAINVGLTSDNFYLVTIDPHTPSTLYAGSWDGVVFIRAPTTGVPGLKLMTG